MGTPKERKKWRRPYCCQKKTRGWAQTQRVVVVVVDLSKNLRRWVWWQHQWLWSQCHSFCYRWCHWWWLVGHLGELSLVGIALATSFADVTGFSILVCSLLSLLIFTYNLQTIQMHFPSLLANQLLAIFLVQDINRFTITNLCKKNIFFNYVFFMIQINRLRKENKLHFL